MSTLTTRARALPRVAVETYLTAARLPLTLAARATGNVDNAEWPPAVVFGRAEAAVDTFVGGLLRDDELVSRGRLRKAQLNKLEQAAELEAVAEQERAQADAQLAAKHQRAEEQRRQAEQKAQQRAQQLEREEQQRKQQVEQATAQRKQAVRKQAAATKQAVQRQARSARLEAVEAETEALDAQQQAVEAADTVAAIDATLDGTREERRTG
jgi:hypothetical protein